MSRPTPDLIVSAADEAYLPLLRGLLGSLAHARWPGSVAVFDLGLSPASRAWLSTQVQHVVQPGWDLPVPAEQQARAPHLRALTVRPFLPRHFPGHDRYLWIDADAWVQEPWAIERYLQGARGGRLAAAAQVDRSYRHRPEMLNWRLQRLHAGFGQAAAESALWETYVNAGVYCLEADAPHWARWADHFRRGLQASGGALCCDQSALNHMLWTERLPLHPLSAHCNWLCHLALPAIEPGGERLVEPLAPHAPIGIVHLTDLAKSAVVPAPVAGGAGRLDLRSPHGGR